MIPMPHIIVASLLALLSIASRGAVQAELESGQELHSDR